MGVGATVNTLVIENEIEAKAGDLVELIGLAATNMPAVAGVSQTGIQIPNREQRRRGVIVSATGDTTLYLGSISGALAAGSASVTGVVNTAVVNNVIHAQVGDGARINASGSASAAEGTLKSTHLI